MAYHNIPLEIRKEYGASMRDVVLGFARRGFSKAFTARTLGILDHSTFDRWLVRLGLRDCFNPANYDKSQWAKPKGRKFGAIYSNDELLSCVIAHEYSSYELRRKRRADEPTLGTIILRFGSWQHAKCLAAQMAGDRI